MIIITKTKSGNTLVRASYPYGRGNSNDRYFFRGDSVFNRFSATDSVSMSDLPPTKNAFRKCWANS